MRSLQGSNLDPARVLTEAWPLHAQVPIMHSRIPKVPTLFVVDDDVATCELLCEIARDAGWHATGFSCLTDLRTSLDEMKPSLLILDDDLPDGLGGDLARELRATERLADMPLVVCTAAHPIRRAEIGSWAPVISKPFDLAEIDAFLAVARSRSYEQRAG